MRWGIILVAIGIACSMVHAILRNDFLRKNTPDVIARDPGVPSQRPRRVFLVRGATPRWVTLLGLPALPLLLLESCALSSHASSQCDAEAALWCTSL